MIKNRDIPRIDDIWIKYDGTRYKIIDVAKDVYSNKNLVICYKIPINEKYYRLNNHYSNIDYIKLGKDYEDKKIVNSCQMYSCFKNIEFTHIFDIKIYILIS